MVNQSAVLFIEQKTKVRCLSLEKSELRLLLEKLEERSLAAGEIEEKKYRPRVDQSAESIESDKRTLREAFKLFLTLSGADGSSLNGGIATVFDSPNFPSDVRSLFFNVGSDLQARFNYFVSNRCLLFLDFSRPAVLNFNLQPSWETPNESNFHVQGNDATWVNGVFYEFAEFVHAHPSAMSWLHRHSIYDVFLWLAGAPLGLWWTSRLAPAIQRITSSAFLQAAFYLYLFVATLFGVRILFHYARWIWPLVEYRHPRSRAMAHKATLSTIVLGIVGAALYDIIKIVVTRNH